MECKKVQDRLITGYVDKELGAGETAEVKRHLTVCPDCREFFEAVQRSAVSPFKAAGTMQPEDVVWQRIQEKIAAERSHSRNWFRRLVEALVPWLRMPQPVFRVAFATALVLLCVVLAKWPSGHSDLVYGYISEQITFLNGLETGNADLLSEGQQDYGAFFEELGG